MLYFSRCRRPGTGRRGLAGAAVLALLLVPRLTGAQTPPQPLDSSPQHMVAFFMSTINPGCPQGWAPFVPAQGRLILGVTGQNGSAVGSTFGAPSADGVAPTHTHNFSTLIKIPGKELAASGCSGGWCNYQGARSGSYYLPNTSQVATSQPATANLPFIQLNVCEKQ